MKKVLFISLINVFGLMGGFIFGQSHPASQDDFNEGQFFFSHGDYNEAVYFYLRLVHDDSLNANFNFKVGECYLNIAGKEPQAVPYFERSVQKLVPKKKYSKRDFNERNAPLHALYYLGNAYRMSDQLNKALDCYNKFMGSPYFWGNYNQDIVEQEIKSCEQAKIIQDAPLDMDKIHLPKTINSDYIEEMPVVSGDGNSLVFLRHLKFYNAVFYSVKISGEWSEAVNINPQIVSDGEFYATGLSFDGTQMLLIKSDPENSDIYISNLKDNFWSKAAILGNKINSIGNESFASFGPDGKSIYLSSDRSGGKGGYDIYVSDLTSSGEWGRPKNLGKVINTEFDEQNPIVCNNGQILIFSSKGHYSMGGYDIFYSLLKDGKWTAPINIGYPINDTRDNLLFYPTQQCREGYMALYDTAGFGESDIYFIRIKSKSVLNNENDLESK